MTKVAVIQENDDPANPTYRAVSGREQATGRTAGEAVDALAARLSAEESDTLIIVRDLRPDPFFNAEARRRLQALMERWRGARDTESAVSPEEQAELERLIDAEIQAAGDRASALRAEIRP